VWAQSGFSYAVFVATDSVVRLESDDARLLRLSCDKVKSVDFLKEQPMASWLVNLWQ